MHSEIKLPNMSIGNLLSIIIAFVYISGFVILHAFETSLGLPLKGLLDFEYLEAGLYFTFFSVGLVGIPLVIFLLLHEKQNPNDEQSLKDVIDVIIVTILDTNLVYFLLFFSFFVTLENLSISINIGMRLSLLAIFKIYFFGAIVIFFLLSIIRYQIHSDNSKKRKKFLKAVRFILFVLLGLISAIVDIFLLTRFALFNFIFSAFTYFLTIILLLVVVSYGSSKIKGNRSNKKTIIAIDVIFMSIILLYISAIFYSFNIYPHMPKNRGGAYPLTEATFLIKDQYTNVYNELISNDKLEGKHTSPLFILRAHNQLFYCKQPHARFEEEHEEHVDVIVIKKKHILRIDISRNSLL